MSEKSKVHRRKFLAQASAAGAVCAVGVSNVAAMSGDSSGEFDVWEQLVGQNFDAINSTNGERMSLVLVDVKVCRAGPSEKRPAHVRSQSCSLLFGSKSGVELDSGTYLFNHPRIKPIELHVESTRWDEQPKWTHGNAVIS